MRILRKIPPRVGEVKIIYNKFLLFPRWTDYEIVWLERVNLNYKYIESVKFDDDVSSLPDRRWELYKIVRLRGN